MVNLSLIDSVFSDLFKEAIVTPLIKKHFLSKDDLKNYRPVCLVLVSSPRLDDRKLAQTQSIQDRICIVWLG